jgi:hypothetical protein
MEAGNDTLLELENNRHSITLENPSNRNSSLEQGDLFYIANRNDERQELLDLQKGREFDATVNCLLFNCSILLANPLKNLDK